MHYYDPEELSAIIDRHNLADGASIRDLETHIRNEVSIRSIIEFDPFLHGGDFISESGKWSVGIAGHVTQTHQEDENLARLWKRLISISYLYCGAASILKMQGGSLEHGYAFMDEPGNSSVLDCTINQLINSVPKEYQGQFDRLEAQLKETIKTLTAKKDEAEKRYANQTAKLHSQSWKIRILEKKIKKENI